MSEVPMWQPSADPDSRVGMALFARHVGQLAGRDLMDPEALWRWSVDEPAAFWKAVWLYCGVVGERGDEVLADGDRMPGARWFPGTCLNYAENLLQHCQDGDNRDALVFRGEDKVTQRMSRGELRQQVAAFAAALKAAGVDTGDRVAGYLPNMPAAVVAMLATASLGAVWSSASPDFGVQGVVDRFGQIEPKVLVTVDGYWYNGKSVALTERVAEIRERIPSVQCVVVASYLTEEPDFTPICDALSWRAFTAAHDMAALAFTRLPFDHPLFIMYSSGTTGVPKCIVHGAGGSLLQHLKEHRFHADVRPGDRVFFFTTCGWMMWNWLATALASDATLLLYDGSPFAGDGHILFDYADAEGMTHFGTSAKFLDAAAKMGLKPRETHQLGSVRVLLSTGSPLVPEGFDYVYRDIKADVQLASISGGTDILSCFVLGDPCRPVWRGEIQGPGLGMAVAVYDQDGIPLPAGERGELVCTRSFPSMPIGFWNDPDGSRYRAAYFERFPGIWCHGDFVERTVHGGYVIYGRSDAVLNPGGVRIGTAEIYRQVEKLPEVVESIAVGQDWQGDVRVVLFVRLRDGLTLDDLLVDRIRRVVRENTTPRHVPARVLQVADIPRTKSGKIVELAVREIIHGRLVKNQEALANPEALAHFAQRQELTV